MASSPNPPVRATAIWEAGLRFATDGTSGHRVTMDADRSSNAAPGPMEMVLRSLCGCTATDVAIVLNKARQRWSGLVVSAEGERAVEPPEVFTRIRLHYRVRGEAVDANVVQRAIKLSQDKYCSVYAMLQRAATITHNVEIIAAAEL
ncbi:MAG: OsmC family protein [Terriglobales bacterium]